MDIKDFKKYLSQRIKEENFKNKLSYATKQKQSRPKSKTNEFKPKFVGI